MSDPHWYMGGRASEQWPSTTHVGAYGLLWQPAAPPPAPPLTEVAEVKADTPQPADTDEQCRWADATITDIDGGVNVLGEWWIRLWLRISVHRRRP